jgi:nucleoside-diphosphate-sugar epimerase
MKVLVTGHQVYIGCVMLPLHLEAGHEVVGLDAGLHEACSFGDRRREVAGVRLDIRDVGLRHLELCETYGRFDLTADQLLGGRYARLAEIKRLQGEARLDDQLSRVGVGDG